MTDISIMIAGALLGLTTWGIGYLTRSWLNGSLIAAQRDLIQVQGDELTRLYAAEAKRQAQRIAAGKKGRATQTARALAKKAAGQ